MIDNPINEIIEKAFLLNDPKSIEAVLQFILVAARIRPGAWTYKPEDLLVPDRWFNQISKYFEHETIIGKLGHIVSLDADEETVSYALDGIFPSEAHLGKFLGIKFNVDGVLRHNYFLYFKKRIAYHTWIDDVSMITELALPDDKNLSQHEKENYERAQEIQTLLEIIGSKRKVYVHIERNV
jgi:hypothetical protein